MSIQTNSKPLKKRLLGLLLRSRSLPEELTNMILLVEIMTLIITIDVDIRVFLHSSLMEPSIVVSSVIYMIIECIILIAVQLLLHVSLIRMGYLRYIAVLNLTQPSSIFLLALTLFALFLDLCKTTTTLICFKNKWAQSCNEIKGFTFVVNILAVLMVKMQNPIVTAVASVLYLLIYLTRLRLRTVNQQTQVFFETLAVMGFGINVMMLVEMRVPVPIYFKLLTILSIVAAATLVRVVFFSEIISRGLLEMSPQETSEKMILRIGSILNYLNQGNFAKERDLRLKEFFKRVSNEELPSLNSENKGEYLNALLRLAIVHERKCEGLLEHLLLIGELENTAHDNAVGLITTIQKIQHKNSTGLNSFLVAVKMYRLQQLLSYTINNALQRHKKNQIFQTSIDGFIQNYDFIDFTVSIRDIYHQLWSTISEGICTPKVLDQKLVQLLEAMEIVETKYQQIKTKSKFAAFYYFQFLKLVKKENHKNIFPIQIEWYYLKSNTFDPMQYGQQIFFSITLRGKVLKIGENVLGLLGFERTELEGGNVVKLVPGCCKEQHDQWLESFLDRVENKTGAQSILEWHKTSLITTKSGNLQTVQLGLHLSLINNQLVLSGPITLEPVKKRILTIKGNGDIVGWGNFQGEVDTRNIEEENDHSCREYIAILEKGQPVKLSVKVLDGIVMDEYSMTKVVANENQDQQMYFLASNNTEVSPKSCLTIMNSITSQQSLITQNPKDQAEMMEKYSSRSANVTCILLPVLLISFTVVTCVLSLVTNNRYDYRTSSITLFGNLEISTLLMTNMASKMCYFDLIYLQMSPISTFFPIDFDERFEFINTLKSSLIILPEFQQSVVDQRYTVTTIQTSSLLMMETIMEIYDWLISDFMNFNNSSRFVNLVKYAEDNFDTLLNQIFPGCYQLMTVAYGKTRNYYTWVFTLLVFMVMVVGILLGVVIVLFDYFSNKDILDVFEFVLAQKEDNLDDHFESIRLYKMMVSKTSPNVDDVIVTQRSLHEIVTLSANQSMASSNAEFIKTPITPVEKEHPKFHPEYEAQKKNKLRMKSEMPLGYVLYILTALLCLGTVINSSFHYQHGQARNYSVYEYVKSISSLKRVFQAYEIMHGTLFQNIATNFSKLDHLTQSINNFSSQQGQLSAFDHSLFETEQFAPFRQYKQELDYSSLCTYITCTQYSSLINTSLSSSIRYTGSLIQLIKDAAVNNTTLTLDVLESQFNIGYIVVVEKIYLNIARKLIPLVYDNMRAHFANLFQKEMGFQQREVGFVGVLGLLGVVQVIRGVLRRKKLNQMLKLFGVTRPATQM